MNTTEKENTYTELSLLFFGFVTTIIILIVVIFSYTQNQHNKWIEEEKARHTWETDFVFLDETHISCNYSAREGGYRYTVKGSITNKSGFSVCVYRIYFKFYDENENLICNYDTGYVGYIKNGETRSYTSLSAEYYIKTPVSAVCYGVKYSLEIK